MHELILFHAQVTLGMLEQVVTVNSIYEYRTPFEVKVANRFPGSSWAVFDVHGLVGADGIPGAHVDH